jgi:hypothetical protein
MVEGIAYTIPPLSSYAFFSWEGCKLSVEGNAKDIFIGKNESMLELLNIHLFV